MNESARKLKVRNAVNRALSGLEENPFLAQRIMTKAKGEPYQMKKRISVGLILTLAAVLVTVSALAIGLAFSPQYTVKRLADKALYDQYGITDEMMTVLHRSEAERAPDGSQVFTYAALEELYAGQVGFYTVTVKDGQAQAVWSHDGETTSGGVQAAAWGVEQLAMLCSEQYGAMLAQLAPPVAPQSGDAAVLWDEAAATEAQAQLDAQTKAWEDSRAQILAASKISLEDAQKLAIEAIGGEYGLTPAQCKQLEFIDEEYGVRFRFEDTRPMAEMNFYLTQREDGVFTEKDGIYVVTLYMDDGMIEDILYDSGLASNG